MRPRHLYTAVIASLMLAACLPPTALANAVLGGFSARPLDPTNNPALRSYFRWHVHAGGKRPGVLLVTNAENETIHLKVYPVDGVTGVTSGAVYSSGGVPLRYDGLWLTPDLSRITLKPHSTTTLRFVARIPANARPGDHIAAIAFENADHPRTAKGSIAIIEVIRSAVAVQMRVAGPATQAAAVSGISLKSLPGTQVASAVVQVTNTGGLDCRPNLAVTLSGGGLASSTVTRKLDLVLPGDSIPYPLAWPRPLGAGSYAATAVVSGCGPSETLHRTISLTTGLRGDTPSGSPVTVVVAHSSSFPWWLLAIVAVGGIGFGWALSRRRPSGPAAPPSGV
jgi:hypothetical protein